MQQHGPSSYPAPGASPNSHRRKCSCTPPGQNRIPLALALAIDAVFSGATRRAREVAAAALYFLDAGALPASDGATALPTALKQARTRPVQTRSRGQAPGGHDAHQELDQRIFEPLKSRHRRP